MLNKICRYLVKNVIKILVLLIQKCITRKADKVYDLFPRIIFADSDNLGRKLVPSIFEGYGIILRRVDEWGRHPFVVVLTPNGLFSCPIVIGISKEIQEKENNVVLTFRSLSSRRIMRRNEEDLDPLNSYPDWGQKRAEHYLWVKYAKQALDIIDTLDKKIPDII